VRGSSRRFLCSALAIATQLGRVRNGTRGVHVTNDVAIEHEARGCREDPEAAEHREGLAFWRIETQ